MVNIWWCRDIAKAIKIWATSQRAEQIIIITLLFQHQIVLQIRHSYGSIEFTPLRGRQISEE